MIPRVKGTDDKLDVTLQNFVLDRARKYLACYNFNQIELPILQHTSLFLRTLGEETDVVTKEMYIFERADGKESICLRPEATAPTMRAFLEHVAPNAPWKVWSFGSMFRHERPQKGRWREFSQINVEVIGCESIAQDAQFIAMLDRFFDHECKLEEYALQINYLGTADERKTYTSDLHEKLELHVKELCDTCNIRKHKNILRVFDCKNEQCQAVYSELPKITDHLGAESAQQWQALQDMLSMLSVSWVHNPKLVRGLDYYNKTVFEFSSPNLGAQSAFCGGGRYEKLATDIGAKHDYPSIGAALGMGRLLMLIGANEKIALPQKPALHTIIPITQAQQTLALLLAGKLTDAGLCTDIILEGGSMKSMMRRANKLGSKFVLILGEQEQQDGTVVVKNMQSGESETVKAVDVLSSLI